MSFVLVTILFARFKHSTDPGPALNPGGNLYSLAILGITLALSASFSLPLLDWATTLQGDQRERVQRKPCESFFVSVSFFIVWWDYVPSSEQICTSNCTIPCGGRQIICQGTFPLITVYHGLLLPVICGFRGYSHDCTPFREGKAYIVVATGVNWRANF